MTPCCRQRRRPARSCRPEVRRSLACLLRWDLCRMAGRRRCPRRLSWRCLLCPLFPPRRRTLGLLWCRTVTTWRMLTWRRKRRQRSSQVGGGERPTDCCACQPRSLLVRRQQAAARRQPLRSLPSLNDLLRVCCQTAGRPSPSHRFPFPQRRLATGAAAVAAAGVGLSDGTLVTVAAPAAASGHNIMKREWPLFPSTAACCRCCCRCCCCCRCHVCVVCPSCLAALQGGARWLRLAAMAPVFEECDACAASAAARCAATQRRSPALPPGLSSPPCSVPLLEHSHHCRRAAEAGAGAAGARVPVGAAPPAGGQPHCGPGWPVSGCHTACGATARRHDAQPCSAALLLRCQ